MRNRGTCAYFYGKAPEVFGKARLVNPNFSRQDRAATLLALFAIILAPLVSLNLPDANASLSVSYNFDTTGDLTNNFNETTDGVGTVAQSTDGGINNSGAIATPGTANSVFSSKSSYSLGPVGSSYTFSSFLQSVGNSGYSGMGFTSLSPATATASGVYRPTDAIGISVHGGGFVLHNGATDVNGSWNSDNPGVVSVKKAGISDLLNSGSPDQWYQIIFKITRDSSSTFDTRVEVWPSSSTGTLLRQSEADAIFEWNDITNATLQAAPAIYSYINFSGDRVRYFDDFSINLAGGATVVEAGAPVVVTTSAQELSGVVTVDGEVTSLGGASLVERGIVYATSPNPTISDTKILAPWSSGDGTGTFQADSATLTSGTYYFRTFATNTSLTSYGSELQQVIAAAPANVCSTAAFDSANFSRIGLPAATYTPSLTDGVVQLTPASTTRDGAVWASQRLNLDHDFEIEAEFKIAPNAGVSSRGDGIAFVLQPSSSTSLSSGGGLGYAGTNPSFAVEFDTYRNSADATNNHIALMKDGNTGVHNAWGQEPYAPSTGTFDLVNANFTKVKFGWNATAKTFTATLDVNRNGTYDAGETIFNAVPLALDTYFAASNNFVYWGFTGATSGQYNDQSVKLACAQVTSRTNVPPVLTAPSATLQVQESRTVSITLQDDSTTQEQWSVDVVSPSVDVSVDSVQVVSATEATVTITGVAEATADLQVSVVDADGASTQGVLSVTVGNSVSLPAPPTAPTTPEEPAETDSPETEEETSSNPVVRPAPPAPSIVATPSPSPTQSPGPTGEGGSVLMPVLEPTPDVVYGSTNPIPKAVVEILKAPLAYVLAQLNGLPELPNLEPSDSLAYENGSQVQIQLIRTDTDSGYILRGDSWQVVLEAEDSSGQPVRLDENANLILNEDHIVEFSGQGFAPGSMVKIWLFSEPTELSEVLADASGNFVGRALIPEGTPVGEHTIQLNGLTKDGQLRSVAIGVVIQPALLAAPAPIDITGLMNGLLILSAGVLLFFFILWRRRKREEEGEIPISSGIDGVPILASEGFEPTQQFPNDSRRKIGAASPRNRKRFSFKPKSA
jgi:hypothetical protein